MEDLKIILARHAAWLRGDAGGVRASLDGVNLSGADLYGADLRKANLYGANLSEAYLSEANLSEANLSEANLSEANLSEANLSGADLRGANLSEANLRGANLSGADLYGADLRKANLYGTNLRGANLHRADLRGATPLPPPPTLLLARWGSVPDDLCVDLMRYDAANHPDPARFNAWAKGEGCPYDGVRVQRAANFTERRGLWSPGPAKSAYKLMTMLFKANGVKWGGA